jgi:CDP-diacylglycerol---glycerol-3-phosphate 3-phosphatidyltransferase
MSPRCGHHGCARPGRETLATVPNAITAVRTIASFGLGLAGIVEESFALLVWSLAVYWAGDFLDGEVARRTDRETRSGAIADIICDRLNVAVVYLGMLTIFPELWLPIGIFLLNFMAVDGVLSLAFLSWPLRSPNYFFLVDRRVWIWNWSRPAKGLNSWMITAVTFGTKSVWISSVLAATVLTIKIASIVRVNQLPKRDQSGCAVPAVAAREPVPAHT